MFHILVILNRHPCFVRWQDDCFREIAHFLWFFTISDCLSGSITFDLVPIKMNLPLYTLYLLCFLQRRNHISFHVWRFRCGSKTFSLLPIKHLPWCMKPAQNKKAPNSRKNVPVLSKPMSSFLKPKSIEAHTRRCIEAQKENSNQMQRLDRRVAKCILQRESVVISARKSADVVSSEILGRYGDTKRQRFKNFLEILHCQDSISPRTANASQAETKTNLGKHIKLIPPRVSRRPKAVHHHDGCLSSWLLCLSVRSNPSSRVSNLPAFPLPYACPLSTNDRNRLGIRICHPGAPQPYYWGAKWSSCTRRPSAHTWGLAKTL